MPAEKLTTDVRREQIAQATLDLIGAKGLAGVSVAAVARRIGLVPSALYRHFPGKDDVLDAAMELILSRLLENVDAACAQDVSPMRCLRALLDRHVKMIRESRGIPLMLLSPDFYGDRPDRRQRVHEGIRAYLARIAELIRQAQRAGEAAPETDPDVASVLFLGLIQPSVILWHMSDGDFDVTRQANRAWPLFERSIQSGPTGGK